MVNQLRLSAKVIAIERLRYTPAGIPALDLLLEHSAQIQTTPKRQVQLQIKALAFGDLAERLAQLPLGTLAICEGFLISQTKRKTLCLHLQSFDTQGVKTDESTI